MNHRCVRLSILIILLCSSFSYSQNGDDLRIWKEFTRTLRQGQFPPERIRPHAQLGDAYRPILLGYLDTLRKYGTPEEWSAEPEIIRTGERIQYIVPWTTGGEKIPYCFSFVTEGNQWYFQHLEAIFIRLDKLPTPPVSEFPDISEAQKAWAREEIYWSFLIMNVYLPVSEVQGRDFALNLLKDGAGYFVGAKTWVPFTSPQRGFILYLCWEQAKLRGNEVTLAALSDTEAVVRLNNHFFTLYFTAAHLKPRISLEEYKRIFETIWQDRAQNAGWNLAITYDKNYQVTFSFKRSV